MLYIISLITAIIPLLTGSAIFWLWFFYPNYSDLELYGLGTIIISTPICLIGLILACVARTKNKENDLAKRKVTKVILLLLSNIPFAIFYFWFAIYLMDTERITIVNNSDYKINDVHIFGCGDYCEINNLNKNESKTVWVHITKEGRITMTYNKNGELINQSIDGYIEPGMGGHKYEYHIKFIGDIEHK